MWSIWSYYMSWNIFSENAFFFWTGSSAQEPEAYTEHSRTFTMELFRKNSWRLKALNYFRKKAQPYMFDCVRNMPLGSFLKLGCLVIGTSFPRKRKVLKALSCGAYWWAALKRGRRLLQSDRYYRDFKNLSFFSSKEKKLSLSYH